MINLHIDDGVFNVDLGRFTQYSIDNVDLWNNHYRLIAYLAQQLPKGSSAADLGTHHGNSAIAFASNPDVTVITIDIEDQVPHIQGMKCYKDLPNVGFHIGDCRNLIHIYNDVPLAMLDIAPHYGIEEKDLVERLIKSGFKGAMLMDDIHFSPMVPFWNWIPLAKFDVTSRGHGTGTGLVLFDVETVSVNIK